LIDSGAINSNYISIAYYDWLHNNGYVIAPDSTLLSSEIASSTNVTSGLTTIYVTSFNDVGKLVNMELPVKFVKLTNYDLIIGKPSIINYDIFTHFKSQIYYGKPKSVIDLINALSEIKPRLIPTNLLVAKELVFDILEDEETDLDTSYEPIFDRELYEQLVKNPGRPALAGNPTFQSKINKLIDEFKDIFQNELSSEPARVTPMQIKVNLEKWQQAKNRTRTRVMTSEREEELKRQVRQLVSFGALTSVHCTYYSHALLVKKPTGAFRFCIDFRNLNDATESFSWPIPNITGVLRNIGRKRAKIFGTMDLTHGYHQFPLHPDSWIYTSFITPEGTYMWKRVVMGMKGAGSYFQQIMMEEVFPDFLHDFVEIYLDDLLIYAETEEEFLEYLRRIFTRLREKNIKVNPKKCKFGFSELDYVGHRISSDSINFSSEQRDKVLNFPLPENVRALQSFLGIGNYFRDHIANYSTLVYPLQKLMKGPKGHLRPLSNLVWTPETIELFNNIKSQMEHLPNLYFMDEVNGQIQLYTDASDYGIGAYLCQIVDGLEKPIKFISKTLTPVQQRWSTIEKECYAIHFACKQLEYLIHDTRFILFTDHRNLIYMNKNSSSKVTRWKLDIQHFDFEIFHIEGAKNIIADAFSRLCHRNIESINTIREPDIVINKDEYKIILKYHNNYIGHHGVDRTVNQNLWYHGSYSCER
jgi:hypothetical protein